jgi:hypothetical protein
MICSAASPLALLIATVALNRRAVARRLGDQTDDNSDVLHPAMH